MTEPADHPIPADLIDKLAQRLAPFLPAGTFPGVVVEEALIALAEWADGAFIDPDGWRRVRAERYENGVELCIVHDEVKVETHDPSGGCAEAWGADCETVPLYLLDPPLTQEDPT